MEYERWRAYYDSQNIKPDPNYVDPGTNRDEDYIESHVDKNPDKFYGEGASQVTVDELPDEAALRDEVMAAYNPNNTQASATSSQPSGLRSLLRRRPLDALGSSSYSAVCS